MECEDVSDTTVTDLKAPRFTGHGGEPILVCTRGNTVNRVVRAHNPARFAPLHTRLEGWEVRLRFILRRDNRVEVVAGGAVPQLCSQWQVHVLTRGKQHHADLQRTEIIGEVVLAGVGRAKGR